MAGWIKLWRNLLANGHFKMPSMAFKLWIYCLLEAAVYPDPKRDLAAGELWLSYQGIRENLEEGTRKASLSTISASLKHLEQNGYITLQAVKFKGIKARVVNWGQYQTLTHEPYPSPPSKRPDPSVVGDYTQLNPPTTPAVVDDYSHSSPATTPRVVTRAPEPYCGKASSPDKNYIKNKLKNINPVVAVRVIEDFVREFGRALSPLEVKQITHWQQTFSDDLIKEALTRASLQDKRSIAYVGGILKNWSRSGITTVEEALKESTKPTRPIPKGGKRIATSRPGYRPQEVDWTNEPDTL